MSEQNKRREFAGPAQTDGPDPHTPGMVVPLDCGIMFLRRQAPLHLRSFYTDIAAYEETAGRAVQQIETASLAVPLIVSFGDPFRIGLGRAPGSDDGRPSFIAGLDTARVFIASNGRSACLQINLTPIGAQRLLGMPAAEFAGRMVPLSDLAHREVGELLSRLEDLDDWCARLDCAQAFLAARLGGAAGEAAVPLVEAAYGLLAAGAVHRVADLAARIGWSRKHLSQRFSREIGLSPKTVARIARFNRVQALARAMQRPDWADIAVSGGYADQAHMIREFEDFAGLTPRAWWRSLDEFGAATWQDPPVG